MTSAASTSAKTTDRNNLVTSTSSPSIETLVHGKVSVQLFAWLEIFPLQFKETGMAQWWERSPPTHIWVRFWLHMWVELNMVGSRPCSESFPPVFLASKKQHFKTVDKKSHPVECPLLNSYFLIPISLFIPNPICPAFILIIRNKGNWFDHLHYHYHICHHVNFRLWRLSRIG